MLGNNYVFVEVIKEEHPTNMSNLIGSSRWQYHPFYSNGQNLAHSVSFQRANKHSSFFSWIRLSSRQCHSGDILHELRLCTDSFWLWVARFGGVQKGNDSAWCLSGQSYREK